MKEMGDSGLKGFVEGLFTAFSLYSILPLPFAKRVKWDKDSMRYALCFFPLVGLVILLLTLLWQDVAMRCKLSPVLFAVVATLLPIAVSGGIHMDGFMDTVDAIASHAAPQRRLEILEDSRVGAFGALGCCVYLMISTALWAQIYEAPRLMLMPAVGYVLSRALSGLTIARFPCARTSGLVYLFSGSASKSAVSVTGFLFAALPIAFCIAMDSIWGTVAAVACATYYLWHRLFCIRGFGGNTGDLAGFFLQNLELVFLLIAAIGGITA